MWDLGSGTLGVATCWAGPTSQSGLGGAALLLARGNFLACAASSGPTEARDGKGRRRQKGNPVREQMPLSGVWEDLFFQLSLPPRPPPPDVGQGPSQGLGGWHSSTLPTLPFVLALWPSKCQLASPQIRAGISPLSFEGMSPPPTPVTPHPR